MRNPFYTEVTCDIPYRIFSILLRMMKGIDGLCEPFVNFGRKKNAEVVSFTTLRPVKQLFFHTFREEQGRGGVLFQTNLDWEKVQLQSFNPCL